MDTAVSLFSPLFALSEKLETSVNKFYERKDLVQHNIGKLRELERRLSRARELIPQVQRRSEHDIVIQSQLTEFRERLEEDIDKIITWHDQINHATAKDRVRLMKQVLDGCEENVNKFYEFLHSNLPALPETPTLDDGRYVPRNTVPVNPPRLTLDYNSGETCEGQVRSAVLEQKGSRIVAFVACGKGGVGKTCALRGLADDGEIKKTFPDGTLFIQLGNDADITDIVQGVANNVERTGGRSEAGKIRTSRTLEEASRIASDWFHGRSCLFLVDDIWKVNGISSDVFDTLGSMVNEKSRLVYTTRDKHFLGRAHKVIEFEEKDVHGLLARRMLLRHGGFDEGDEPKGQNKVAFEAILDECQGLPLAFGIAGGVVLKKCRRKSAGEKQDAWTDLNEDMKSKTDGSKLLEYSAEQYGGLHRIVDLSLQVMGSEYEYDKLFRALCVLRKQQSVPLGMLQKLWDLGSLKETEEVAEIMDGLSIVQMREVNRVSYVQLHDLVLDLAKYKASRRYETQHFPRTLIGNYIRYSKGNSGSTLEVQEGGIVSGNVEEEQVGAAIVSQDRSQDVPPGRVEVGKDTALANKSGREMFRHAWWSNEDDGYLHNNVCRVLQNAGYSDELLWLLSQPQWIVSRLLRGGINNLEQDLEEGKAVIANNGAFEAEHKEHLEMIGKAARLGCTFVSENDREVWFQVHGRLLQHARVNERTREFVEKMEQLAPRPWVKASIGMLQQASRAVHDVIAGRGAVICTSIEQELVWFVWKDGNKMGVSRYNTSTGSYRHVDFVVDRIREDGWLPNVECASFIDYQSSVVSAHRNGKMYIWSRETGKLKDEVMWKGKKRSGNVHGESMGEPFRVHLKPGLFQWQTFLNCFGSCGVKENTESCGVKEKTESCEDEGEGRFVAFSTEGKLVVTTCDNYTIRMWNTLNGEAVGQPRHGHTERVNCVAVSADGTRIASGSYDTTVRVWEAESGEAVGKPLCGHTSAVSCVAISADGSRIVSGSWDKTVRVWEPESGEAVGQLLCGHTRRVSCVGMSADGSRIVSGSLDATVRVWEAASGEIVGEPLCGHTDRVSCVTMSGDGSRIVSGSDDRTVRLWEAESGKAQGQPLHSYTGLMRGVAVSADGTRIVSGSGERTLRVWDAESRGAVGEPLVHDRRIMRVGVDAHGLQIASKDEDGLGRLWDTQSGECVLTSADASWKSSMDAYALVWSPFTAWRPRGRQVTTRAEDGSEVVLATCEVEVANVDGGRGDVFWSDRLGSSCRIVR